MEVRKWGRSPHKKIADMVNLYLYRLKNYKCRTHRKQKLYKSKIYFFYKKVWPASNISEIYIRTKKESAILNLLTSETNALQCTQQNWTSGTGGLQGIECTSICAHPFGVFMGWNFGQVIAAMRKSKGLSYTILQQWYSDISPPAPWNLGCEKNKILDEENEDGNTGMEIVETSSAVMVEENNNLPLTTPTNKPTTPITNQRTPPVISTTSTNPGIGILATTTGVSNSANPLWRSCAKAIEISAELKRSVVDRLSFFLKTTKVNFLGSNLLFPDEENQQLDSAVSTCFIGENNGAQQLLNNSSLGTSSPAASSPGGSSINSNENQNPGGFPPPTKTIEDPKQKLNSSTNMLSENSPQSSIGTSENSPQSSISSGVKTITSKKKTANLMLAQERGIPITSVQSGMIDGNIILLTATAAGLVKVSVLDVPKLKV